MTLSSAWLWHSRSAGADQQWRLLSPDRGFWTLRGKSDTQLVAYQILELQHDRGWLQSYHPSSPLVTPAAGNLLLLNYWQDALFACAAELSDPEQLCWFYAQTLAKLQRPDSWRAHWPCLEQQLLQQAGYWPSLAQQAQGQRLRLTDQGLQPWATGMTASDLALVAAGQPCDQTQLQAWHQFVKPFLASMCSAPLYQFRSLLETL